MGITAQHRELNQNEQAYYFRISNWFELWKWTAQWTI